MVRCKKWSGVGFRKDAAVTLVLTVLLLTLSNIFMTLAWYGHLGGVENSSSVLQYLGSLKEKPWFWAVLVSWCVAFVEYVFQVPANRIGHQGNYTLAQLKILQEVISLTVFVGFLVTVRKESLNLDFLWAGLCLCGAVYFVFRKVA